MAIRLHDRTPDLGPRRVTMARRIQEAVSPRANALVPNPTVAVVSPGGTITHVQWTKRSNGNGALVHFSDGELRLDVKRARAGWIFLQELYEGEGFAAGWDAYKAWKLAAEDDGARVEPFPLKMLPREVIKRRGGEVAGRMPYEVKLVKHPNAPTRAELAALDGKKAKSKRKRKPTPAPAPAEAPGEAALEADGA